MRNGTSVADDMCEAKAVSCSGQEWNVTYKDVKHSAPRTSQAIAETIVPSNVQEPREITLVLGGEAGQGLQTTAQILALMFMNGGLHVLAVSEFMSRIRGGSNSVTIRAAHRPVRALNEHIDSVLSSIKKLFSGCKDGVLQIRCWSETPHC